MLVLNPTVQFVPTVAEIIPVPVLFAKLLTARIPGQLIVQEAAVARLTVPLMVMFPVLAVMTQGSGEVYVVAPPSPNEILSCALNVSAPLDTVAVPFHAIEGVVPGVGLAAINVIGFGEL